MGQLVRRVLWWVWAICTFGLGPALWEAFDA